MKTKEKNGDDKKKELSDSNTKNRVGKNQNLKNFMQIIFFFFFCTPHSRLVYLSLLNHLRTVVTQCQQTKSNSLRRFFASFYSTFFSALQNSDNKKQKRKKNFFFSFKEDFARFCTVDLLLDKTPEMFKEC